MEERLTQEQLTKLVAEVDRLAQLRQDEVDRQQVEAILRELSLPPELLDDAMIQLQRREALAIQQRRNRWILAGVAAGLIVILAGGGFWFQQNQRLLSRVSAQQERITLVQDGGERLTEFSRQTSPELFYQVTLKDAPVGKSLSLSCDWVDPNGQVVKQNHYQTREINTPVWETHCRYQLEPASPTGTWKVRLFLGDRLLSDTTFVVK